MDKSAAFLEEVLGKDGAAALLKAVRRSPSLASVLVPRAIIGWTMSAAAWGYSGALPGSPDICVDFRKSETPGLFSGSISSPHGQGVLGFNDTTLYRIAAHVAVALDVPALAPPPGLKDLDLARLGKSIDALAKAQLLAQATAPTVMSSHGDVDVVHAGVGAQPYSLRRRKDGRVIVDHVPTLADAQRLADWQSSIHNPMVPETHPLDKVALDPNLGYKITHEHTPASSSQGMPMTRVNVHSPTGEHVGTTTLIHKGPHLQPMITAVDEAHQRRGIASAMYAHAQRHTGKSMIPSPSQTDEGAALWSGTGGNFGKVELPGRTAHGIPQQGPAGPIPPQKQPRQAQQQTPKADAKGPGMKAPPRTPEKMPSTEVQPPSAKAPSMKVGKSEAHGNRCRICQQLQFGPDGGFYGCLCLRGLCYDVVVKSEAESYELEFGPSWDEDARSVLLEMLKPVEP